MKQILVAVLLWPCAVMADQIIQTKDDQRILLRDDSTYKVFSHEVLSCKEDKSYVSLDYHYRYMSDELQTLVEKHSSICAVVDLKPKYPDTYEVLFKFAQEDQHSNNQDGEVFVDKLDIGSKIYLMDHCKSDWCRVVVYGTLRQRIWIDADKIIFG